eukprot:CAMPEP_0116894222 /NCGR_PEP_ID=MMETSP0467-20121206/4049_1 /TAXON_ID=283647 /ORGANISM="Mesodinium pulex, Strain SPMC105" /LENGTH=33 /DNA_ID= /DNA_START= /DNA_END= /DNA_ORIENTATION=
MAFVIGLSMKTLLMDLFNILESNQTDNLFYSLA